MLSQQNFVQSAEFMELKVQSGISIISPAVFVTATAKVVERLAEVALCRNLRRPNEDKGYLELRKKVMIFISTSNSLDRSVT